MKQYETFELTYKVNCDKTDALPNLTAVFTDESCRLTAKGFAAGDGIYKIRYYPRHRGRVSWKVSGVVTDTGEEYCEKASSGHHGMIRAIGTHLEYDDGSLFTSFGTTVYALAHQDKSLTEETFMTLSENPFNKVRMCLFPKHYDYNVNDPEFFPFKLNEGMKYTYERGQTFNTKAFLVEKRKLWDVTKPDYSFWNTFEDKLKRLDALGIQADLILFHPYDRWGFSYLGIEKNKVYLDYLIRRFSAFPNVWFSMANEYDLCSGISPDEWKEIENFIGENDAYHHMLSNHNCFTAYDFSGEYITHCSLQKRTMTLVPEYMAKYGKPVLYDECVYEGNLKQTWGSLSGAEMMNRFWKVTTHGGYCTHGEVFLDVEADDTDNAVLWWAKGGKLQGKSPARIAFLRSLMEEINRPLTPYSFGGGFDFDGLKKLDAYTLENKIPHPMLRVNEYRDKSNAVERIRHYDPEVVFAGHYEDEVYLFYYGTDCCARADIEVSDKHTYRIDVIDAWNMTRKTAASGVSGKAEIKLTGHEYMAVLAVKEN